MNLFGTQFERVGKGFLGGVVRSDFVAAYRGRGRPKGSVKADAKQHITLRLDRDVIERFRETGPGWQVRINEVLKRLG
jgi:uncharacterized protein (DUF4415 family)